MPEPSALGPIDPASIHDPSIAEEEKAAPWIMRKLIGVSAAFRSHLGFGLAMNAGQLAGHGVQPDRGTSERRKHCGSRALHADSLHVQVLSALALHGDHCVTCGGCALQHGGRPQVSGALGA